MAVDLLSENSCISPRISFSHEFSLSDAIPIENRPLRSSNSKPSSLNSSVDFDFCIPGGVNSGESFDQGSWSADELFSNGKILPTEIKKKPQPGKRNSGQNYETGQPKLRDEKKPSRTKPVLIRDASGFDDDVVSLKSNTKSFWGFKRSSSLNCGSGYGRSFCPLTLLSRSNSTGSSSTFNGGSKQKQSSRKNVDHVKLQSSSSVSSSSSSSSSSYGSFQKPPLKKNYGGYKVSPVINMVPSGNLFGFGSIFAGNGKDRNKKR